MALGNGAPDIFSSFASVSQSRPGKKTLRVSFTFVTQSLEKKSRARLCYPLCESGCLKVEQLFALISIEAAFFHFLHWQDSQLFETRICTFVYLCNKDLTRAYKNLKLFSYCINSRLYRSVDKWRHTTLGGGVKDFVKTLHMHITK